MMEGALSKILRSQEEVERRLWSRYAYLKIGLTNGCFDVLHRGHLEALYETYKRCDVLFVIVNSDISVKKLKGPTRPINNQEDRALMLASLFYVSYVVISGESERVDKEISWVKPHVYTKSGDYTINSLDPTELDVLKNCGSEIVFLPTFGSYSTTNIIKRVSNSTKS